MPLTKLTKSGSRPAPSSPHPVIPAEKAEPKSEVATTCRSNTPFICPSMFSLGSAPGWVSQKLSGKWSIGAEESYRESPRTERRGCGVPVHRNHPSHGRGFLHRAPGAKQQRTWGFVIFWGLSFPGIIFPAPKMRTGSTKCLTRKLLLGVGAALGNGGLRKTEHGLGEELWGKPSSECFSSLYPFPEKGDTKGRLSGLHESREGTGQAGPLYPLTPRLM